MQTTLNKIREKQPCTDGWTSEKLLQTTSQSTSVKFSTAMVWMTRSGVFVLWIVKIV
jgi:hypothetical protein